MTAMMISHHKKRQRRRSESLEPVHPHAQVPQEQQTQPLVTPEADEVSDDDFSEMNPSSPSAEQRRRSRRERSRSRDRTPPDPSSQDADEDSATVDLQNSVSDRSRSPQEQEASRGQDPQQQKGKKTVAEEQPSDLPSAKKHKSIDSDEDEEEPQNEPGTSSNTQTTVPVLPCNSGDEDSEYSDEYSAQSRDSEKTLHYPDLYVLTNDEHWTMTPETHKYAAAAGSFCFATTENGNQQDICSLITMPCVQRSLHLNGPTNDFDNIKVEVPKGVDGQNRDMLERCMATCGRAAGTRANTRSRARKEASAQEVRGYYEQFAEAKHLESRSMVDNEVFDLINMRKKQAEKLCDRTTGAHHQDGHARQLPQNKSQMGIEWLPGQIERIHTD